jgi:hypothetical protein
MEMRSAAVVLEGRCISVYIFDRWPPDLPPLVKACPPGQRAANLFKILAKYGRPIEGAQALALPTWLLHALAALAMALYVRDADRALVDRLIQETPATIVAMVNEFAKRSRNKTGPAIAPGYYAQLGRIVLLVVDAYFEQQSSLDLTRWAKGG